MMIQTPLLLSPYENGGLERERKREIEFECGMEMQLNWVFRIVKCNITNLTNFSPDLFELIYYILIKFSGFVLKKLNIELPILDVKK